MYASALTAVLVDCWHSNLLTLSSLLFPCLADYAFDEETVLLGAIFMAAIALIAYTVYDVYVDVTHRFAMKRAQVGSSQKSKSTFKGKPRYSRPIQAASTFQTPTITDFETSQLRSTFVHKKTYCGPYLQRLRALVLTGIAMFLFYVCCSNLDQIKTASATINNYLEDLTGQGMHASALTALLVDCWHSNLITLSSCLFPCLSDYAFDEETIFLGATYMAAIVLIAYTVYDTYVDVKRRFAVKRSQSGSRKMFAMKRAQSGSSKKYKSIFKDKPRYSRPIQAASTFQTPTITLFETSQLRSTFVHKKTYCGPYLQRLRALVLTGIAMFLFYVCCSNLDQIKTTSATISKYLDDLTGQGVHASALTALLVDCWHSNLITLSSCLFPCLSDYAFDEETIFLGATYMTAFVLIAYTVYDTYVGVKRRFAMKRSQSGSRKKFAMKRSQSGSSKKYKSIFKDKPRYSRHSQATTNLETPKTISEANQLWSTFAHKNTYCGPYHRRLQVHGSELDHPERIGPLGPSSSRVPLEVRAHVRIMYHDDIQRVLEKEIKREAFRKISERAKEIRHHRRQIHQLRSSQRYENDKLREEALQGLADLFDGSPRRMKKDWGIFEDTTMRLFESKSFNPFAFHCEALDDHRSDEEVEQPPDSNRQTIQDRLKRPRYRVGDLAAKSLSPVLPHNEIDEPLLKQVSVVLDRVICPQVSRPMATCSILRNPRYQLCDTFGNCKSSSSPSRPCLQFKTDLDHPEHVRTDVRLMYIDDEQHEPEKETKLEAISLQFVDEALNNIGSEEEAEEQLARDRAQWALELDTCRDRAICHLAGLFNDAEQESLQNQSSEPQLLERAPVRRSRRLAALPRVDYSLAKRSVRRSRRLAKLDRVDYKE